MTKKVIKKDEMLNAEMERKVSTCIEKKLNECDNDCKLLKRQIAGLRGENTKLKNALEKEKQSHNSLCQEIRDLQLKLDALHHENDRLHHELCNVRVPWYMKIFKRKCK